jgi:hypothetical protein
MKPPIADLPYWPLYLSRDEAARYVGVSPTLFDDEVAAGLWPQPVRRGSGTQRAGRVTWYRPDLEAAARRRSADGEEDDYEARRAAAHAAREGRKAQAR